VEAGLRLDAKGCAKVRNYLKRTFRRVLGRKPRVRKARSFAVDNEMYQVFTDGNRQCIAVATLTPGERVTIPLAGMHAMEGNLRVVLLPEERCMEIHLTTNPRTYPPGEEEAGIDLGVTEALRRHGKQVPAGIRQSPAGNVRSYHG